MKTGENGLARSREVVGSDNLPADIILDAVPTPIAYVDADFRFQYVNQACEKWLGKERAAVVGRKVSDMVGIHAFDRLKSHIALVRTGKQMHFEYWVNATAGLRYVDVSYAPHQVDGTLKGYTIQVSDITDSKEAADFLDNVLVGVHWVDGNGIITWANDVQLNMLGYSAEEFIGHHISEFYVDPDAVPDILPRMSSSESLHEYEASFRCRNGSVLMVSINSNALFRDGSFVHARCFTIDISRRKRAEAAMHESGRRYRQLVRSLPIAFYTCDRGGRITYYNRVAMELWGFGPALNADVTKFCAFAKAFIGGEFVPPERTPMAAAIQTGKSFRNLQAVFERADGTSFNACVNIDPLYDARNNLIGAISVIQDVTQLKTTERALIESEAQYAQLLQLLPSAVYTCDAEGRLNLFNRAAVELWGRAPLPGQDFVRGGPPVFYPDGEAVPPDACPAAIALKIGRSAKGREMVVQRPDGTRRNVMPYSEPIRDAGGKVTGVVSMLIDITDQKRASQALRESEQRFRTIANLVPVILWMTDKEGHVNYLNAQWKKLTGRNPEDGYGTGWAAFIHPDDRDEVLVTWHQAVRDGKTYTIRFRHRTLRGGYRVFEMNGAPRHSGDGEQLGYVGVMQDVTQQEEARRLLEQTIREKTVDITRKTEARYQRMIAEVQDYAIIFLSPEGLVENWNKGAEKIKGYSAAEIIGKSFEVFYPEEDREKGLPGILINRARMEGRATYEGWRVRKDGSRFWGSIVITALHDNAHHLIGFTKMTRDLTAVKTAQDELHEYSLMLRKKNGELEVMNAQLAEMNRELAAFAYISSHDLQEPLRKIQTFSSRILELEDGRFGEKSKDYFNRMLNAAHRMRLLIDDILSYSRANSGERKFFQTDLNGIFREVAADLQELIDQKGGRIECAALPTLSVIPLQFQQVLMNVLANALKFTKPGVPPVITITASIVDSTAIPGAHATAPAYHCIAISDNGIGFDAIHKTRIFEIFQRLHNRHEYEGTGVGLAICKKIMENHHGFITAEGVVNQGATFSIFLPVE